MAVRSIKSAERTLRLFELFSRRQEPLTVGDVSRGLGIPQPSASMLLTNLTAMGYLTHQRLARSYAPTVRVSLLGGFAGPRFSDGQSLAQRLNALHDAVGEDVFVGIQNDAAAQIVQVRGQDALNIDSGQMYSLTGSVVGQVLLALQPDSEVVRVVRRCNAEAGSDAERVNEADFLTLMAAIRRDGHAVNDGFYSPDRSGVAVAVRGAHAGGDFAVGFGGPTERIKAKRALIVQQLTALKSAARADDADRAETPSGQPRQA